MTIEQLKQLKTSFLNARNQFFQKKIILLSEYDSGEFLRGYIGVFKDKLTTILSQYQAVFGDSMDGMFFVLISSLDALLHAYLSNEVTQFLSVCETRIQKITSGAVLASLFRDMVYMCDGLSIIHCNFYCLLQTLMTTTVAKLMDSYISFYLNNGVFFIDTGN